MPTLPTLQQVVQNPHPNSFLRDFVAMHGPIPLLGRALLAAETAAWERGVTLSFATFEELVEVNQKNLARIMHQTHAQAA